MKAKSYSIILFLIFFNTLSIAQDIDKNNIYFKALKEYACYVDRFEPETDTVYFEVVKGITTYFPKEINGLKVIIITALNQQEIYSNNGGQIVQRKMIPAQVLKDKINIGIIPYQGQYLEEKGGIKLSLSKWHSIIFMYDKESKSFKYKEIQNNG